MMNIFTNINVNSMKLLNLINVDMLSAILLLVISLLWMKLRNMFYPFGSISDTLLKPLSSILVTNKYANKLYRKIVTMKRFFTGKMELNCFISCDCPHSFVLLQCIRYLYSMKVINVSVQIYVLPLQSISSSTSISKHM